MKIKLHCFFFVRILFIRITRLRFAIKYFTKLETVDLLTQQSVLNETLNHEKQFKHIFGGSSR